MPAWLVCWLIAKDHLPFPAETMMSTPPPATELQQPPQQALHYALANAQQVQIHQIGEDGQVQVVCTVLASLPLWTERGGCGPGSGEPTTSSPGVSGSH